MRHLLSNIQPTQPKISSLLSDPNKIVNVFKHLNMVCSTPANFTNSSQLWNLECFSMHHWTQNKNLKWFFTLDQLLKMKDSTLSKWVQANIISLRPFKVKSTLFKYLVDALLPIKGYKLIKLTISLNNIGKLFPYLMESIR